MYYLLITFDDSRLTAQPGSLSSSSHVPFKSYRSLSRPVLKASMSTSIDSSVGKVAESGYRGARVQFKALHLDYINDHPESIVWVEEKGFAPDRDLEREPPAARIWLVKLPGLERTPGAGVSGEQMMVMKVVRPTRG